MGRRSRPAVQRLSRASESGGFCAWLTGNLDSQ
eukprot:gene9218-biopygen19705